MPEVSSTETTKIYENANLTVKARLDPNHAESIEEVTFKFLKDGEQFEEKTIPVSQGERAGDHIIVSYSVQAPAVPDDKDRYFLDYHYFYKVKKKNASAETLQNFPSSRIQVFPRVAWLKVTDQDGKALPNFEFTVEQDGQQSEVRKTVASDTPNAKGETIAAGSCEFNLSLCPTFRIVPSPPYKIVEEVVAAGRKREIKGGIGLRAAFVAPQKGSVRQFVNYDVENFGQDGIGHEVTVEVGVNPEDLPFLKPGDSPEVQFRVTFGPADGEVIAKSARDDADHPTKVMKVSDADTSATIEEKEAKKKYQGKVKLTGGSGKFVVALGKAGGDSCTVEISGSDKFLTDESLSPDSSLNFENWRHIHYELMVPDTIYQQELDASTLDFQPNVLQKLDTFGRSLFIEFLHEDTCVFDARGGADYGALGPKRFFGTSGKDEKPAYALTGRNWRQLPKGQFWSENVPMKTLYVHICDRLLKWRKDTKNPNAGTSDASVTLTEATGMVDVKGRFGGLFMPFSGLDAGDAVTDIVWTADISKDDSVCKYTPSLTMEEFRYEAALSPELSVDMDFEGAFGIAGTLVFNLGGDASSPAYSSELNDGHISAIKTFVGQLLASYAALADTGGSAAVCVSCREGDTRGESKCIASVKTKLQASFDELKKDFSFHPALDPANEFSARTGSCSMADITDFATSTLSEWHFRLPEVLEDGSAGPGAFVGTDKTKTRCPVKFEFSFRPHEASRGEADGKLIAWVHGDSSNVKYLTRLVLQAFDGNGDKAGLAHGHSDGKPGDCLETADVLCDACAKYGRARNLTTIK